MDRESVFKDDRARVNARREIPRGNGNIKLGGSLGHHHQANCETAHDELADDLPFRKFGIASDLSPILVDTVGGSQPWQVGFVDAWVHIHSCDFS